MAIDLQSLSLTSAFNSIISYFRSQENNSAYRDLTNSSEGSFLIRLLANVMSVISYRIVAQSRENYLSTAALPASNIGIAVNLGYSVPRGSNLKRLVKIIPNGNYTFPRFSVLGSYISDNGTYNILLNSKEDVKFIEGQPIEVEVVVGNVKEDSFITGTSDTKIFSLFNSKISDDFVLFKDNIEVPTTTVIKEMLDNKYLVRTNPYSSVDIAFLNNLESTNQNYQYGNGTEITIRYVELADVIAAPFTDNMFTYGTLIDYRTIHGSRGMETVDSIKVTAPLYHEVQNLIRSKADYASALRINVPDVTEVNFRALTPSVTQITYLKDKFNLLTGTCQKVGSSTENREALVATEVGTFLELLKNQNYFGTPLPDIKPPKREEAYIKISIALKNKYKNVSDINLDVENILRNFYDTYLHVNFNTYELERKIEDLSYVKYARVEHIINDRNPNAYYQMGYITYDDDSKEFFKVSNMLAATGSTDNQLLDWAPSIRASEEIDTNAVFQDGEIYWKCYKKLIGIKAEKRYKNKTYALGDFMYVPDNSTLENYMFKCIDIVRYSGTVKPDTTVSELGDFIEDGGLVWVVIDRITDPAITDWESSKSYRIGERVNGTGNNFSLECIGYAGRSSTSTVPNFFREELPIVAVEAGGRNGKVVVEGNYAQYFKKDDAISGTYRNPGGTWLASWAVSKNASFYYSVDINGKTLNNVTVIEVAPRSSSDSSTIDESNTYLSVFPVFRYSIDGELAWELVKDVNDITYDWDSYLAFKHEIEIID